MINTWRVLVTRVFCCIYERGFNGPFDGNENRIKSYIHSARVSRPRRTETRPRRALLKFPCILRVWASFASSANPTNFKSLDVTEIEHESPRVFPASVYRLVCYSPFSRVSTIGRNLQTFFDRTSRPKRFCAMRFSFICWSVIFTFLCGRRLIYVIIFRCGRLTNRDDDGDWRRTHSGRDNTCINTTINRKPTAIGRGGERTYTWKYV